MNFYPQHYLYFKNLLNLITSSLKKWEAIVSEYEKIPRTSHRKYDEIQIINEGLTWLNTAHLENHKVSHVKNVMSDVIESMVISLNAVHDHIIYILNDIEYEHVLQNKELEAYKRGYEDRNYLLADPNYIFARPLNFLKNYEENKKSTCWGDFRISFCRPKNIPSNKSHNSFSPLRTFLSDDDLSGYWPSNRGGGI